MSPSIFTVNTTSNVKARDAKTASVRSRSFFQESRNGKDRNLGSGNGRKVSMDSKSIKSKVIKKSEFEELKKLAENVAKKERDAAMDKLQKERERQVKESMQRKEVFRKIDMEKSRKQDSKLSEIEDEARKRAMHLLDRAYNLKLEQEDEIKKCNRIILETKCRAIRDAQLAEKKLIKRELAEEEKRLNEMMENERRWGIKEDLKKEQEEIAKKQKYAELLKSQIVKNEEQRIMEFEKKQEESKLINLSNDEWKKDEIARMKMKEEENKKVRKDLNEGNEQLKRFKALEREENRIIDERIKEYQMKKAERDAKIEEEKKLAKQRKDRERTLVAAQTLQAYEMQAQIDEINAARIQEEVEREWRQREKEEALKKIELQRLLKAQREQQIDNKRIMQAIEIERDKMEFDRILGIQKEAFAKEKEELERKQKKVQAYKVEIKKQVNMREQDKSEQRQRFIEEGMAIRAAAEIRKKKLCQAMEKKCQEMKENKVPEIYINEVKRMIESIQ
ncbi:cilia- and flagella-associated protein 45-like isoform X2 [Prorops nasuta]|uniref:cilia- and flagella-associated protein 45-like isoform X2 n=1 Tax=Prorops nasuta TaxID=863751 RepID=UPI0034CFA6EB